MSFSYSSDISLDQFSKIKPVLESARKKTRPRIVDLYAVFLRSFICLKKWMPVTHATKRIS